MKVRLLTLTERNFQLDNIKGIAIFMVVLGHLLMFNSTGFENTVLFNVIWTLQIPLFMFVSGYLVRNGSINSLKDLIRLLKRKFLTLLCPWLIWTGFIKAILFDRNDFIGVINYFAYILSNMDSGYWFLFSLWIISSIYLISNFISSNLGIERLRIPVLLLIYFSFLALLFVFSQVTTLNFLGLKFTMYYMIVYISGSVFRIFLIKNNWVISGKISDLLFLISLITFLVIMFNINLYNIEDNLTGIFTRFTTSMIGVFVVFKIVNTSDKNVFWNTLGVNSMKIYLAHTLFVSVIKSDVLPNIYSIEAMSYLLINGIIMIIFSGIFVKVLSINKVTSSIFFGS